MTDVDDLIVDFRAEAIASGDVAERVAGEFTRRKLREAIAAEGASGGPRRARARLSPRRRAGRLLIPSVSAAALAAGVFVLAAGLPSGDSGPGDVILPPLPPASASAAVVLEHAASVAARQAPSPFASAGQFAYSKVLSGSTTATAESSAPPSNRCWGAILFSFSYTEQNWVAPNGSGRQLVLRGANTFPQPRFRTIARRFHEDLNGVEPSFDARYRPTMFAYSSPAGLPTDPRKLLAAIVRRFEHGKYDLSTTFYRAEGLLVASASPALRAALYRMLAQLPGVQYLGHQRDQIGRAGVAIGVTEAGGARGEILFDPVTSKLLAEDDIQVAPERGARPPCMLAMPVGTVVNYSVYLETGIVNSITETPGGGNEPFRAPGGPTRGPGVK